MWKLIKILLAGIAVSCYFFPFEFTFLPGVNTKMAMAGVGLVLYALDLAKGRAPQINKDGFQIAVIAALVSLCGLASVIINNTNDYTYATYIVSMFVWLGGAYTAVKIVKWLHGYVSVELICNYLIGVCVGQCVLALMIDLIPSVKSTVDKYVLGFDFASVDRLEATGRLYGIGAAVDVAGTRFSAALIMIAFILQNTHQNKMTFHRYVYVISFIVIAVVGNMIARTTTVGLFMAIIYLIIRSDVHALRWDQQNRKIWEALFILLVCVVPILMYLYSNNGNFHNSLRFAFEGFFSIAERGYWETNSNNILKNMIVFPDNIKTWIIGDGYFENPYHTDPYYVGERTGGFYKGTDIGYLRFIFYFGVLGLSMFVLLFIKIVQTCLCRMMSFKALFVWLLMLNMLIWLKVSTDIFVVFALFLCISIEHNDAYENSLSDSLDI